jgi:hypothetical protein
VAQAVMPGYLACGAEIRFISAFRPSSAARFLHRF